MERGKMEREKGKGKRGQASVVAEESSSSTARASVTLATRSMLSVSGHKTETMFYKYVKLSLDEYADSVASAAVDGLF